MRHHVPPVICAVLLLGALAFSPDPCWAIKSYVTEAHEIAFRSGPGTQNRVMRMLSPGTGMEVLTTRNDWSKVRLFDGPEDSRVGWVLSRFLTTQSPEEVQSKGVELENASLKDAIKTMEKEKGDLSKREKELLDKIAKLEASYEALKSGSANYIKFKEEFDQTKAALSSVQANNQALLQENENMKLSQNIKWFIVGAAVLAGGWAIGLVTGRLQRRRKPQYR
ncbi:MAG: TIGR04211 family SH3 domain-containing protein [Syntrophobacteraceae bacterium]